MALPTAYLVTTRNLEALFNSLITARAPDFFTIKFLQGLDFKSTNDRLYIGVLKNLGFLDEAGAPTPRYFSFLDQTQSKQVLAEAIKEAYSDLFDVYTKANELPEAEVKNKLRTLTQGKYSETVVSLMAKTFRSLVEYADWTGPTDKKPGEQKKVAKATPAVDPQINTPPAAIFADEAAGSKEKINSELHYNIQIHLPESRDPVVYDAIFKSLHNHLDI